MEKNPENKSRQKPCPSCGKMMIDWETSCPWCGAKLKTETPEKIVTKEHDEFWPEYRPIG